jgi:hypothetical protein
MSGQGISTPRRWRPGQRSPFATADLGHDSVAGSDRAIGAAFFPAAASTARNQFALNSIQTLRTPMASHDLVIGRQIELAGSVAVTVATVFAAVAVGIAPMASAAPSERHCLEQHCLAAEAPTIRQGPANVQIVTSPKALPTVFPGTNNPRWRGLGYNARWPKLGHNPKWEDFG